MAPGPTNRYRSNAVSVFSMSPMIRVVAGLVLNSTLNAGQQPPRARVLLRVFQGVDYLGLYERLLRRPRENI